MARLRAKGVKQQKEKYVRVPGLVEYLADVGSEASIAASPDPDEVSSDPTQEVTASPHSEPVRKLLGPILW